MFWWQSETFEGFKARLADATEAELKQTAAELVGVIDPIVKAALPTEEPAPDDPLTAVHEMIERLWPVIEKNRWVHAQLEKLKPPVEPLPAVMSRDELAREIFSPELIDHCIGSGMPLRPDGLFDTDDVANWVFR